VKKAILAVVLVLVVIAAAVIVVAGSVLGPLVRHGVESVGSAMTRTRVTLAGADVSLIFGRCRLTGLEVANPPGYDDPLAIRIERVEIVARLGSLLARKVRIREVRIVAPNVWVEGSPKANNLTRMMDNASSPAGESAGGSSAGARCFQVDDLTITDGKLHLGRGLAVGKDVVLALPTMHLVSLGTGPEGVTGDELTRQLLGAVSKSTAEVIALNAVELGAAVAGGRGVAKDAADRANQAIKGLRDLLQKK